MCLRTLLRLGHTHPQLRSSRMILTPAFHSTIAPTTRQLMVSSKTGKRGWWLLLPMLLLYCVAGLLVEDILTTKTGLSFWNLMSLSGGSRLRDLTFFLTDLGIRVEKSGR